MATATSTAARLAGAASSGSLRADERRLVASAGLVFALASAGAAMSAAAADAMFLSEIGPAHLGGAVAASNALLAIVLAVVGALADRVERRRVLAILAVASAIVIGGLAALSILAPRAAAATTLVGGKQLAAATDLAFWVVIAERLDARRSRRLVPVLAATGGAGAAIGAVLVRPRPSGDGSSPIHGSRRRPLHQSETQDALVGRPSALPNRRCGRSPVCRRLQPTIYRCFSALHEV